MAMRANPETAARNVLIERRQTMSGLLMPEAAALQTNDERLEGLQRRHRWHEHGAWRRS
jgi:hypothetical protein